MIKVLLDTNSLIYTFDNKKDLYAICDRDLQEPFSFFTIDACVNELKMLRREDVVKWLDSAKIKTINCGSESGSTDSKLLAVAKEEGCALFTYDRELLSKAVSAGIKTLKIAGQHARF